MAIPLHGTNPQEVSTVKAVLNSIQDLRMLSTHPIQTKGIGQKEPGAL